MINRRTDNAMRVAVHLSRVQRHPQPHLLWPGTSGVVPADRRRQPAWQAGDQVNLWYLWRNQDERAIAAILAHAAPPLDPAPPESLDQRVIESIADRELVQVGPVRITEPFHVNNHDRAMNRKLLVHSTSPLTDTAGPTLSVVHRAKLPDITSVTPRGYPRKPGTSPRLIMLPGYR